MIGARQCRRSALAVCHHGAQRADMTARVCSSAFASTLHPCLHSAAVSHCLYIAASGVCLRAGSEPTHLCLCFGFFEQMMYTYFPPFLLTLLHPLHSFLTELRTFMPLTCSPALLRARPCALDDGLLNLRRWKEVAREDGVEAVVTVLREAAGARSAVTVRRDAIDERAW